MMLGLLTQNYIAIFLAQIVVPVFCKNLPLKSLYIVEKQESLDLPCQLIEKSERHIVLAWYKLVNGKSKAVNRVRFEHQTYTVYLTLSNVTESDSGFYFCTVMYLRDGSWFGKFYEAVTKPLITYVKVVNETRNELIAGLVSDGI